MIVFYNHCHAGDLASSRGYIQHIMRSFPNERFAYCHKNHPDLLKDMDIETHSLDEVGAKQSDTITRMGDITFINTWLGAGNGKYYDTYSIQSLDRMMRAECREHLGLNLPPLGFDLAPKIYFDKVERSLIDSFWANYSLKDKITVMICNNATWSGQSSNFDMMPLVNELAKLYPDYHFFLTNWTDQKVLPANVTPAWLLTNFATSGCDMLELAYLGSKCNYIIGRSSGPYSYCLNQDTVDSGAQYISICNKERYLECFGLSEFNRNCFTAIHDFDIPTIMDKLEMDLVTL